MTSLADHIVVFARLLRRANIRVGTGSILAAVAAVEQLGLSDPDDLAACLFAFFVQRQEHRELFSQAFSLYWRRSGLLTEFASSGQGEGRTDDASREEQARRLADALANEDEIDDAVFELEFDKVDTASAAENLQRKDFESMSAAELRDAEKMLSRLRLAVDELPSRRFQSGSRGSRLDMRASLRASLRADGLMPLRFQRRKTRQSPIVVLCDISGSMSVYSRMFLHFMHAVSNDRGRTHSFVFGTRLSNITRQLRFRDVDKALAATARSVKDWSGGTRIEDCLRCFNRRWSRRVPAQGAVVVLISDGLDRGDGRGLQKEMERLAKSSRRLIWLNPLLRYQGFEPRATGIRAMLPYVDDFRSAHSVNSLIELAELLAPGAVQSAA